MHVIILIILLSTIEGTQAIECPSSHKEWLDKLDSLSNSLIPDLGNHKNYEHGPKLLSSFKYKEVSSFWNTCKKRASDYIRLRYKNIIKHSEFMAKTQSEGHSGFILSDEEYLINSLSLNPEFAALPKVFFKDNYLPLNWRKTVENCKKDKRGDLCRKIKDWKFIEFNSTLEDGSGSHKRIVIQINHKDFIQYLLFFPEHPTHNMNKLIDIISLQTKDLNTGLRLDKVRPFFFERHKKGFAKDGGRCITCHPNGLREIIPTQGSFLSKDNFKIIKIFNNEVRLLGKPDWQNVYDPKKLGPPLGGSCVNCHSEEGERSPLTIFTKPSLIKSKIHELEMPYSKLYSLYFNSLNRLQEGSNEKLKRYINHFLSKSKALPSKDYRSKEQIRNIRKKIQKILLEENVTSYIEYLIIRAIDDITSIHTDYKLKQIFENQKKRFKNWLMNKSFQSDRSN
jgi:hypothetical protein